MALCNEVNCVLVATSCLGFIVTQQRIVTMDGDYTCTVQGFIIILARLKRERKKNSFTGNDPINFSLYLL